MKRILSILILTSILLCSFAACTPSESEGSDEKVITKQEAIAIAEGLYTDNQIAGHFNFIRYNTPTYNTEVIYSEKCQREPGADYEPGYAFHIKGTIEGMGKDGNVRTEKFRWVGVVYLDGTISLDVTLWTN